MAQRERERRAYLNPKQAARAERVAADVQVAGILCGVLIAIMGAIMVAASVVTVVGMVLLPAAALIFLIGCVICALATALEAHIRNVAHQTRMLARLVDLLRDKGPAA